MSAGYAGSGGSQVRSAALLLVKLKADLLKRATSGLHRFAAAFHESRRLEAARVIARYGHLIQRPAHNDLSGEIPSGTQPRRSP